MLTIHLPLVPRLRKHRLVPPLPHVHSWSSTSLSVGKNLHLPFLFSGWKQGKRNTKPEKLIKVSDEGTYSKICLNQTVLI